MVFEVIRGTTMKTKQIVEAIGLVKTYGGMNVVDGVLFSASEGEVG